jgi:hypothetical protein
MLVRNALRVVASASELRLIYEVPSEGGGTCWREGDAVVAEAARLRDDLAGFYS